MADIAKTAKPKNDWSDASSFGVIALVFLAPISAGMATASGSPRTAWLLSMVFLILAMFLIGWKTNKSIWGVLIDNRNVMSLSRFQMVAWTGLIVSAIVAAAFWNMTMGNAEPLDFGIPGELWMLMGISTTSLVASPLIVNDKKTKKVSKTEEARIVSLLESTPADKGSTDTEGAIVRNTDPKYARWSDMLTGEETGNAAYADIPRIQMFFFTIVVLSTYAVSLWTMFGNLGDQTVEAFPTLNESVLALIGISHAGYIAAKAAPHSKPADDEK